MTKGLGWIGVLSLVCAGVSAGPVIEAQNRGNHRTGSNDGSVYSQRPPSTGRSQGTAATSANGSTNSREQHPDLRTQPQPYAARLPLAGAVQPHPGAAPAQTRGVAQTQSPSTNQLFEENLHGMNSLVVPHGAGTQSQPSMTGTFKTNLQNQTPPQNQAPTQNQTFTESQLPSLFSTGERKPPPPTNTQNRKPKNGTPLQQPATGKQNQNPWKQTPGRPPTNGYIEPPDLPRPPTLLPFPGQQVVPTNNLQPQPAVSYSTGVTNQPPSPSIASPSESQAKAPSEDDTKPSPPPETPKLDSLGPQQNPDERKIANRPKPASPAPHVDPVPPAVTKQTPSVEKKALVTASLASLAGAGFWILHMLLNVTTGCRWDVPKVTVVGPQTHVSLSFVPDVGPAEERITFLKTKRRSG